MTDETEQEIANSKAEAAHAEWVHAEETAVLRADLEMHKAALEAAEQQRDECAAEAFRLREALGEASERLTRSKHPHDRAENALAIIVAALAAPSRAADVLEARDGRIRREQASTDYHGFLALLRGEERPPPPTPMAGALAKHDAKVRAAASYQVQMAVHDAIYDVCANEEKAISKGSAPYTITFRRVVLLNEAMAAAERALAPPDALAFGDDDSPHPGTGRLLSAVPVKAPPCLDCNGRGEYHHEHVPYKCESCGGSGVRR